jgi:hypothetical protein
MSKLYILLDKSGSMEPHVTETINGLSAFMKEQSDDTLFTLNLFNDKITTIYSNVTKENARPLNKLNYRPQGGTALMDAIGAIIKQATDDEPKSWADQDDSVITIVIMTDGAENSSKEYTQERINELIEFKRLNGWKFVFLGANQDSFSVAGNIGIDRDATLNFDANEVNAALSSVGSAISRMTSGQSENIQFTQLEREASQPSAY